jgi:hypothetical protein
LALKALEGVGVHGAEWEERTNVAHHVRRRLTKADTMLIGEVVDLRGTPEAHERWERIRPVIPKQLWSWAEEELKK